MQETFEQLRALMLASAPGTVIDKDGPTGLSLNAAWANPLHPKQAMYFGGVTVGKAYIGYHLMPVYGRPALLAGISPELRKRMQGKSCFNFKKPDPVLFEELAELTRTCAHAFAKPFTLEDLKNARCD